MKQIQGILLVLAAFFVMSLFTACGSSMINDVKNTQIKFAFEDIGKTYGEVLDGYCSGTKWRTFTSSYVTMIEFSGTTPNGQKVVIQWVQSLDSTYDVCWAWSLDDKEQDILINFKNWVMSAAKSLG